MKATIQRLLCMSSRTGFGVAKRCDRMTSILPHRLLHSTRHILHNKGANSHVAIESHLSNASEVPEKRSHASGDITQERRAELQILRSTLGIGDVCDSLLNQALTHSSYVDAHNQGFGNNERMEFLGDTVLDTIISTFLYTHQPGLQEGQLTSLRSSIVNRNTLHKISNELNLPKYLKTAAGTDVNVNIASDTLEAIIAAIFLHGGLARASAFVLTHFEKQIQAKLAYGNTESFGSENYKGKLQEVLSYPPTQKILFQYKSGTAKFGAFLPKYISTEAEWSASAHMPTFMSQVVVNKQCLGTGEGSSKKAAEQQAAEMAYKQVMQKISDHKK